jgi:sugar lactone lactonase YvrE
MKVAPKRAARFDCEGLAVDAHGNLYLSEESQRVAYRLAPAGKMEAIVIDWSPVRQFFGSDPNASFEGIAVNGDRMYLANERSAARIVVVDLNERKVLDSFFVDSTGFAFGGPHYTDLAFADGHLFILNRNHRCIFEIEPETKRVLAEYSFAQMELDKAVAYFTDYPTGTMEGLAVDTDYFWMITDNNGKGRIADPADDRPTLFRCKRPRSK